MFRPRHCIFVLTLLWGSTATLSAAQAAKKPAATDATSSAQRAVSLAQSGNCKEALPLLKQAMPHAADKDLKRNVGFAGVRCAMFADQPDVAEDFLRFLNREFPRDPDVLYLSVHTYSDLSTRAAAELATTAPKSPQALELDAEALEAQGKWDEAAKKYRLILQQNPRMPGIHFRLGRLLLSKPNPPTTVAEEAKKEMQQELEIDPSNAGAEYVLGALAQQNQHGMRPSGIFHAQLNWIQHSAMPLLDSELAWGRPSGTQRRSRLWRMPSNLSRRIRPRIICSQSHTAAPAARKTATNNLPFKGN